MNSYRGSNLMCLSQRCILAIKTAAGKFICNCISGYILGIVGLGSSNCCRQCNRLGKFLIFIPARQRICDTAFCLSCRVIVLTIRRTFTIYLCYIRLLTYFTGMSTNISIEACVADVVYIILDCCSQCCLNVYIAIEMIVSKS